MKTKRRSILASVSILALATIVSAPIVQAHAAEVSETIFELRRRFNETDLNMLTYRSIDQIFETSVAAAGRKPRKLATRIQPIDFSYTADGEERSAEEFAGRTFSSALLIVKDDEIVHEKYYNFSDDETRFLIMSVSKSVTSALIGIAIGDGDIESVDDQVTKYVPELESTPFKGVTLRDVLEMRTGIDRNDGSFRVKGSVHERMRDMILVRNELRATDEAFYIGRKAAPGSEFEYSTLNTNILGLVLERVTGKRFEEYLSEKIWKPIGAESDAVLVMDGPYPQGRAINGMAINAVARDMARFGMLMLNGGAVGGKQIVPADWVAESTVPGRRKEAIFGRPGISYGYQWWTMTDSSAYMAIGVGGQYIYIDPDTRTVVVKMSYHPTPQPRDLMGESLSFFRAAAAWSPK